MIWMNMISNMNNMVNMITKYFKIQNNKKTNFRTNK